MKYLIILLGSLLMTSCASIFCGSKAQVTFDSDISEKATLTIDGRKHTNVTFPYTTKIRRGFDETIKRRKPPTTGQNRSSSTRAFNAVSVINLLDVLGWGIDAATGAITKPEFKFLSDRFPARRKRRKRKNSFQQISPTRKARSVGPGFSV